MGVGQDVLRLVHKGQTSHIASNYSLVDIAVVLYENLGLQDRVVWSKGWASALFYILNARKGVIDKDDLFDKFPNPPYGALLDPTVPGVWVSGGSMANGLAVAVGMAYAKKLKGEPGIVYCLMSDGELQEGMTWEAILQAGHDKLDNLVAIIDYNKWCAMGKTNEVLNLEPLAQKLEAFNWTSQEIEGHEHWQIETALDATKELNFKKPNVIIAHTTKGKGVSFFENHLLYHYKHVEKDEFDKAMAELSRNI